MTINLTRSPSRSALLALALTICASLCGPAQAQLKVVATLPDLGALAKELGGERVELTTLALATEDPHFVDARPSYLVALSRAELLILNGMELEDAWLGPLIINSRNAQIQRGTLGWLDASLALSQRLEVPAGAVDRSQGDVHALGNPHYSYDPRAMLEVARLIRDRLCQLDAEGCEAVRERHERWARELSAYVSDAQSRFAKLKRRDVVVYHRSWSYFAQWLDLSLIAEVEPKPGIPPSPAHVARLVKRMKSERSPVLLQESYQPTRSSKVIAQLTKAQLLTPVPQVKLREGERYLERLKRVTEPLYQALLAAQPTVAPSEVQE